MRQEYGQEHGQRYKPMQTVISTRAVTTVRRERVAHSLSPACAVVKSRERCGNRYYALTSGTCVVCIYR